MSSLFLQWESFSSTARCKDGEQLTFLEVSFPEKPLLLCLLESPRPVPSGTLLVQSPNKLESDSKCKEIATWLGRYTGILEGQVGQRASISFPFPVYAALFLGF